jgi:hypothetical protein
MSRRGDLLGKTPIDLFGLRLKNIRCRLLWLVYARISLTGRSTCARADAGGANHSRQLTSTSG